MQKGNYAIDEADSLVDGFNPVGLTAVPDSILYDYAKFFKWAGGVIHPRLKEKSGKPVRVLKPFWYQTKFANMKRGVLLGGNKLAKTKGELINDIRTRLMPEHAGYDMLLVAQNQMMANQHLLSAKKWMLQSATLKPYLIIRPDQRFRLPEEKSKMTMMYIENPYEPDNPSRIIAIGFSESLAYSWDKVDRLHISDPGQNTRLHQQAFFSGLYSRLSNTEGAIKIEGVASERKGYFWELCRKLFKDEITDDYEDEQDITDPDRQQELDMEELQTMSSTFDKLFITADDGLKVGIITQQWLDDAKSYMPYEEYLRIYYCKFAMQAGTIFNKVQTGEHESLGVADILG